MENVNLDLFLMQMGIVPKKSEIEELDDEVDLRSKYMAKGWYNDPRDENGEVPF
jgi:hypothetical protein